MRLHFWVIIAVMALIVGGCGASGRTAANRQPLVAPNPTALPAEDAGDDFGDFDQIEKELDQQEVKISDPLKPLNKAIFHFNDKLYLWVLEPLAKGCKRVVPEPARISIRHFFNNLATPARFVNCHLQGKHKAAGRELHRFAYNTTFGVLGFSDPARTKLGLEPTQEDLGQTLGKHGAGTGIYLVLPLLGPSNVRDAIGVVGDQFLNPVRYVDPREASIAISAGKMMNEHTFRIGEYESDKEALIDPYIGMRKAYIQYRARKTEE